MNKYITKDFDRDFPNDDACLDGYSKNAIRTGDVR